MSVKLSIIMPCLNEAETIGTCIKKAQAFLKRVKISGEVVIGDNGSVDGSQDIAKNLGAIVVNVEVKGYGSASRGAIDRANGDYIISADTDDSHDILNLDEFVHKLDEGYDLVIGNRFKGDKLKESMPFLHRYVGNPVLTFIGNIFFKTKIGDFHCGLRGFTKEAYNQMNLSTVGMEFASEMIVKASLLDLKITEVSTTVYPSGRSRKAHLRSFPDGWRHLRFLLLYSPKWLFLIPGVIFMLISFIGTFLLIYLKNLFVVEWIPLFSGLFLISFQFVIFYALTKIYATNHGLIPRRKKYNDLFSFFTLERGLLSGLLISISGILLYGFGFQKDLDIYQVLSIVVPATIIIVMGVQVILFSFFFSILGLKEEL
ncbi:glycosyltransferase family 2 protein [Algibacter mikhailovii]|uniref:Dolichol-P-glucose synthetase n=1 Tax=Algibacter mikhailovii TaxID=425498 RepID=A0A918R1F8_9FLAO|nr:glycosyltransferase family 2 protein [Algibacter mikhailovii]GGZ81637.1 dolichol-P-glucose synthetase [Algibacter mikhailovii]